MVGAEFLDRLSFYQSAWLPARAVVEEAVKQRHEVQLLCHRSGMSPVQTQPLAPGASHFAPAPRAILVFVYLYNDNKGSELFYYFSTDNIFETSKYVVGDC